MTVLQERTIKIPGYKSSDLNFRQIRGNEFCIQMDGNSTISVYGKHSESNIFYPITLVNLGTLSKATSVSAAGLYFGMADGLDEAYVEISSPANGMIHIKEVGD